MTTVPKWDMVIFTKIANGWMFAPVSNHLGMGGVASADAHFYRSIAEGSDMIEELRKKDAT